MQSTVISFLYCNWHKLYIIFFSLGGVLHDCCVKKCPITNCVRKFSQSEVDTDFPANLQRIPEQAFGSRCPDRLYQVLYMGRVTSPAAIQGKHSPYLFQLVSYNLNPEKLI